MWPADRESLRSPPDGAGPPRVVRVDPHRSETALLREAARVLAAGGLVAFPTETVYGLGARGLDARALSRLFVAKGRPRHHPLIAHVASEAQAAALAARWPDEASRLARAFWPGPLTIVVERAAHVDAAIAGGGPSIAIRVPDHPVALGLVRALGEAIAAPSANRFQGLSPTTAVHVVDQLGDAVDLVLDGGPCAAGIESTVVDLSAVGRGAPPRILRPGAVSPASIRAWLPDVERVTGAAPADVVRPSPGMDGRHYAPRARLSLTATAADARTAATAYARAGRRVGLVLRTPDAGAPTPAGSTPADVAEGGVIERRLPPDPIGYGRLLYATLHELDRAGVTEIVVERVPDSDGWWAIADRLDRASAPVSDEAFDRA